MDNLDKILSDRKIYQGLTSSQANEALKKYGPNQLPEGKKRGWFIRFWDIFSEPMMLLLIATGIVYVFIGDRIEATVVWLSIIPIGLMEFFEEKKTDEAIAVLDKMAVKFAKVYRDNKLVDLEFKYIVPGDLIYMTAGDQISADGYLLRSFGLSVDESVLTGESFPVTKTEVIDGLEKMKEENILKQGTLVVQGEGYMLAESTGVNTSYGRLGSLLEKIEKADTPLQRKIHSLVRSVAFVAIFVAVFVGIIIGLSKGWQEGLLGGLTLAMSLIPEEFPVVFSVFLIMGMWRLSKQKSLVREMVMVETLGSATVICTDKTGTLTEGRMSLEKVYYNSKISTVQKLKSGEINFHELIETSLLALERIAVDPIEIEVQKFATTLKIDTEKFFSERDLLKDSSFDAKSKMVHHIWKDKTGTCKQYSVGAPESIINACKISVVDKQKAIAANETMANEGYRVIGVAVRECNCGDDIKAEGMKFVGLLAMSDPPRAGVKNAMEVCKKAGIKVLMVTGDNKLTAHNIAEAIGMEHNEEILSGTDLEKMSEEALKEAIKRCNIFARVQPEHKYLIVKALQDKGEVVAMTGDGVNDAPALRQANIGIAMGVRGTEVARAASGMVLMDDNFTSIVDAVREGRRIYENMRHAFMFLLSFHLPIVGLAVLPLFFGHSMIFLPVHIIFLELICDPAAVLGFDKEKARHNLMSEPPRPANESLINPSLWWKVMIQSLGIIAITFAFYYYYSDIGSNEILGRTIAFSTLVISQIFLIAFTREWEQVKENRVLLSISGAIILALFVILLVPVIRDLFKFAPLNLMQFVLIFAAPLLPMALVGWATRRK